MIEFKYAFHLTLTEKNYILKWKNINGKNKKERKINFHYTYIHLVILVFCE